MLFILEDNEDRIAGFRQELGSTPHHIERTFPEARDWLAERGAEVDFFSLDNDLYLADYEGEEGEGWQLCEWILANLEPRPIIVHSTNTHASQRMKMACEEAGWDFHRVVPYLGMQWIGEAWIEKVREVMEEAGSGEDGSA